MSDIKCIYGGIDFPDTLITAGSGLEYNVSGSEHIIGSSGKIMRFVLGPFPVNQLLFKLKRHISDGLGSGHGMVPHHLSGHHRYLTGDSPHQSRFTRTVGTDNGPILSHADFPVRIGQQPGIPNSQGDTGHGKKDLARRLFFFVQASWTIEA